LNNRALKEKLAILKKVFELFDEFSEDVDRACAEGCGACCTRNVTLTTLEADHILDGLTADAKEELLTRIANELHKKRLTPKTTINELAKLCMAGEEPPEEFGDPAWGACPLLSDQRCMIYDLRPLACRSMVSKERCDVTGFAQMDDYTVTLSNIFTQYVEHIDIGGYFGNLSDILLLEGDREKYGQPPPSENILVNQKLEILMVPPEHRQRVAEVISAIKKL